MHLLHFAGEGGEGGGGGNCFQVFTKSYSLSLTLFSSANGVPKNTKTYSKI